MQASSLPEVNSRQLRAVLAVAEYRSFIAAAAFLKTSQPALTRTIKQIEGALGASLFSRSTRQVSITEAGKEFVALAERLLNDLKIGVENMRELAEQRRGQITVASIMSLAHVALPRIIAEYNRHFPGIEIHLREGVHGNVQDSQRLQSPKLRAPPSALERAVERLEQGRIALVRAESLTAQAAARRQRLTHGRHNPTWRPRGQDESNSEPSAVIAVSLSGANTLTPPRSSRIQPPLTHARSCLLVLSRDMPII